MEVEGEWTGRNTRVLKPALLRCAHLVGEIAERCEKLNDGDKQHTTNISLEKERVEMKVFRVSNAALMKCGKSTFGNCVLGESILPEAVYPETSAIVFIEHTKTETPVLFCGDRVLARGYNDIYHFVQKLNEYLRAVGAGDKPANPHGFDESMRNLLLKIAIPALGDFPQDMLTFLFMDTPGVNEKNPAVVASTKALLHLADVAIYLFDTTKLNSTDEEAFLRQIVTERPDLLSVDPARVFFIFNKIDMVNYDEALIQKGMACVKGFLRAIDPKLETLAETNFLAVSTGDYLMSYLALENKLRTEDHITGVHKMLYGNRPMRGPLRITEDDKEFLNETLEKSRYRLAESVIFRSLTLNAPKLFATAVVGNLLRECVEMNREVTIRHAVWCQGREKAEATVAALKTAVKFATQFQSDLQNQVQQIYSTANSLLDGNVQPIQSELATIFNRELTNLVTHFAPGNTPESVAKAIRLFSDTTESGMNSSLGLQKAKLDIALREKLDEFKRTAEHKCRLTVERIVLECLRGILPDDQLASLKHHLDGQPSWETVETIYWNGAGMDLYELSKDAIEEFEETVIKQETKLRPAEYQKVTRTVGDGSGSSGGETALGGAATGAGIGAVFGPIAAAVGAVAGGILGFFGGRRSSKPVSYTENVVVREAELYNEDVEVIEKRYRADADAMREKASEMIVTMTNSFLDWYREQAVRAVGSIEKTVSNHYEKRLKNLITGLEKDVEMYSKTSQEQADHLACLESLLADLNSATGLLSRNVCEIIV